MGCLGAKGRDSDSAWATPYVERARTVETSIEVTLDKTRKELRGLKCALFSNGDATFKRINKSSHFQNQASFS